MHTNIVFNAVYRHSNYYQVLRTNKTSTLEELISSKQINGQIPVFQIVGP